MRSVEQQLAQSVTDQLGTPRIVLDQTGSLANVSRHDYLSFGEELFAGTGGRTTAQGYTASDNVRQKFTSKERDSETGLDYFLARYYSWAQGRFTSPDEFAGGPTELFTEVAPHNPTFYSDLANPQSLNKYQYCLNNPLLFVDPDGHQEKKSDMLWNNNPAVQGLKMAGQTLKNTGIGAGKGLANVVIDTANAINHDINTVAPGTVSYGQRFEASTDGEKGAMLGVDLSLLYFGARGAQASATAMVNASRTSAMTEEMRMGPVTEAARSAAEQTRLLPNSRRPGAAGALQTGDGTIFTGTSGRSVNHPLVQAALDRVPLSQRSVYHGGCTECRLASRALFSGRSLRGARFSVFSVSRQTPMESCTSCRPVMHQLRQ